MADIQIENITPSALDATDQVLVRRGAGPLDHTMDLVPADDLVADGSITSAKLASDAVGNDKLANMSFGTIKARVTAGSGNPEDATGTEVTALLDTFTSGAKGLVPASGGGTTNFLRADGSWSDPSGGGDVVGPASATDNALARFNTTTGKLLQDGVILSPDSGELVFPTASGVAAPSAGEMAFYGQDVGGRMLPTVLGPSGLDAPLQPHFGFNSIGMIRAVFGTSAPSLFGVAVTNQGTQTAVSWSGTSRRTRMRQYEVLNNTASTTAVAGPRFSAVQFSVGGNADGDGGFFYVCRWGPATGVATTSSTHRAFAGMRGGTPSDVNPSTLTNMVGMGWDSTDSNIQFMHNDASGTATKIDLGASFPRPTADRTDAYELVMFSPPGTTQSVSYRVRDLLSGAEASGVVTTDLPSTTQGLGGYTNMSVGGTSSIIGVTIFGIYFEVDY